MDCSEIQLAYLGKWNLNVLARKPFFQKFTCRGKWASIHVKPCIYKQELGPEISIFSLLQTEQILLLYMKVLLLIGAIIAVYISHQLYKLVLFIFLRMWLTKWHTAFWCSLFDEWIKYCSDYPACIFHDKIALTRDIDYRCPINFLSIWRHAGLALLHWCFLAWLASSNIFHSQSRQQKDKAVAVELDNHPFFCK